MGKKSSATAASKISTSSALTTSTPSASSSRSSILKSSFAPSYLQLHLFASVIQSFEAQQLRIHDTTNGRLKQQHSLPAGANVTCLDWGCYGQSYRDQRSLNNKKKRKRTLDSPEDVVVAYGTTNSEICMYSPAEGKIVGTLRNGHEREIRDFKFSPTEFLEAWSVGGDGKLVQWDLKNDQVLRFVLALVPLALSLANPVQVHPFVRLFDTNAVLFIANLTSDLMRLSHTICDSY